MTDSFIKERADAILTMLSPADLASVHVKLKGKEMTIESVAIALAEQEKRMGVRTAKVKLVKALSKLTY
ncbi:MAG: hypothetical protein ACOYJ2_09000 [Rickettsiales bacterium]